MGWWERRWEKRAVEGLEERVGDGRRGEGKGE